MREPKRYRRYLCPTSCSKPKARKKDKAEIPGKRSLPLEALVIWAQRTKPMRSITTQRPRRRREGVRSQLLLINPFIVAMIRPANAKSPRISKEA
jgi:hypothetical protein